MEVAKRIDKLNKDFLDQLNAIRQLSLPGSDDGQIRLYKKTLLLTLIDCLAGIRFDKKNYPELATRNRRRFTRLVEELGGWSDCSRISTPFLVSRLEERKLEGPLLNKVRTYLDTFDPDAGNMVSLGSMDFMPDDLIPFATRESEEHAIYDVQHTSLLYKFQNYFIHEFRQPGYGMEIFAEGTGSPCYHSYIDDDRYYLVYPIDLLEEIAESAINGIRTYFRNLQIDQYDRVSDTSRW